MGEDKAERKDVWGKVESLAKTVAGVGAGIGAILIPIYVNDFSQQSQRSGIYMQIMSEREKADTDIRRAMFTTLLEKYLGEFKDEAEYDENVVRKRIMFLDLLNLNFQEYLNAKPLFEDVYGRLERARKKSKTSEEVQTIGSLQDAIIGVAKRVASKQAAMLANIGLKRAFQVSLGGRACIRLYDVRGLQKVVVGNPEAIPIHQSDEGQDCSQSSDNMSSTKEWTGRGFPSIEVQLHEVRADAVRVVVIPYQDFYNNGTFIGSKRDLPIEFEVSYFDLPYMDNTKLFDGSRFALVLSNSAADRAQLNALIFKEEFMSLRDRPLFEEMLRKLQQDHTVS